MKVNGFSNIANKPSQSLEISRWERKSVGEVLTDEVKAAIRLVKKKKKERK